VQKTREYTVDVTRYNPVEKEGKRKRVICEWVTETVPVTETYYERVPFTTTVRVPIYTGVGPCTVYYDGGAGCASGHGGHRGSLFGRFRCR
jgi:hypothetical protein